MNNAQAAAEHLDYEGFLRDNRRKVNRSLNMILWFGILAGPAIALGVLGGVFKRTDYLSCVIISVATAAVAFCNWLILKRRPFGYVSGILALVAVDALLCGMNVCHISIRLTWALVPFLSLLFCDRRVYVGVSVLNWLVMALATWLEAPHYASVRTDFASPLGGFINIFAGCTIEALIIFAAGFALGKATNNYYRKMIGQYAEAQEQQQTMQKQLEILDSMAQIYDHVNLIDFTDSTETSLREDQLRKLPIAPGQDHTSMSSRLREHVAADMADDFWRFTDLSTLPARMVDRRSISGEFVSNRIGWFRAQYIRVKGEQDRAPDVVIYTIQNIDADKRREEQLIRISRTDELTRMYNRRCYEDDVARLCADGPDDALVIVSADVNGLKTANDTLGHAAGDELIRGAAFCLFSVLGSCGKVYRTGGDEFMAIIRSGEPDELVSRVRQCVDGWRGKVVEKLALSIGYARRADHPDAGLEELEKLADDEMYADKQRYYRQTGVDRRKV